MPESITEGVFTIENEKSQKAYAKYFNAGKKDKRSKAIHKSKKQKKNASVVGDAPQVEAEEMVGTKQSVYNLKKAGHSPVSISPQNKDIKLELGDQLIRS